MNTRPILDDATGPTALSITFNDDNSHFAVALENGFSVYSAKNGELKRFREVGAGIGSAQMLGLTKYIALVGGGKQPKFPSNKVIMWNDSNEVVAMTYEFHAPVQRVCLSKRFIVVTLLNTVNIYEWKAYPNKHATHETVNNPFGLCCVRENVIAFPGISAGLVRLIDAATGNVQILAAHSHPLMALELSRDGSLLATASEAGTLFRVWSTETLAKVTELRRGVDPATIFSLAISPDNSMLAATSDKSTLHLFDLPTGERMASNSPGPDTEHDHKAHKWGILSKIPVLPRQFRDTYSFASVQYQLGDEPLGWGAATRSPTWAAPIPGVPGGRPTKGLTGWLDEQSLVVVGAGQDARWEKFAIGLDQEGKRVCYREAWKKYLE